MRTTSNTLRCAAEFDFHLLVLICNESRSFAGSGQDTKKEAHPDNGMRQLISMREYEEKSGRAFTALGHILIQSQATVAHASANRAAAFAGARAAYGMMRIFLFFVRNIHP